MEAITELAGTVMAGVQSEECDEIGDAPMPLPMGPRCGWGGGLREMTEVEERTEQLRNADASPPLAILGPGGDYTTEIRE